MPTCPHCSYELVLLSDRSKYKCALCSKLYFIKYIDNKEFREWNKKKKEFDIENYEKERKEELMQLEEVRKSIKQLFRNSVQYTKKYREDYYQKNKEKLRQKWKTYYHKNKEKLLEQDDKWREANQEKYSLTNKKWLVKNKNKRKEFLKAYRINNLSLDQQNKRLAHWRKKQIFLADTYLENSDYNPCNIKFFPFSPTFSLCELLAK